MEAITPEGKVMCMALLERHVAGSAPADAAVNCVSRGMSAEGAKATKSKSYAGTSTNASTDTLIDLISIYDVTSLDPTLWKRVRSFPVSMGHVQWKNGKDGGLKDAAGLAWSLDGSTLAVWDHALEVVSLHANTN